MARSSVGLDVGTKAIGIAEVRYAGGRPSLARFGRALLPAGAVEHGEVREPDVVASAISGLWKQLGLKNRSVHVGVSNRHCVVRVIELPVMSREDLENAIRYQAQEQIPIPLADAVMDFEVLEEVDGNDEQRMQRVLVVAAERTSIDSLLQAVNGAHLEAQTLELNAYPLVRCFNGHETVGAHAIVDVGGGVTNVVVHHGGKIRFTRILPTFSGEEFTAAIAEGLGVDRDEAEALKREASALLINNAVPSEEDAARTPTPAAAARIVGPLLDRLVSEVRGSLDFFAGQPNAPQLERVVLTGGGSLVGGLAERLAAAIGVPIEHGHAFDHVPVERDDVTKQELAIAEPFLGVAVGLALAENGG